MKEKLILIIATFCILGVFLLFANKKNYCLATINENTLECYVKITINDGWDLDYMYIINHVYKYEIARFKGQNNYKLINETIYIVNSKNLHDSFKEGTVTMYYQSILVDGKVKRFEANNPEDMYKYFIVNINSGDVESYKSLTEMDKEKALIVSSFSK